MTKRELLFTNDTKRRVIHCLGVEDVMQKMCHIAQDRDDDLWVPRYGPVLSTAAKAEKWLRLAYSK